MEKIQKVEKQQITNDQSWSRMDRCQQVTTAKMQMTEGDLYLPRKRPGQGRSGKNTWNEIQGQKNL